ncbi:unnamed protein product [Prorocentrum cordatum]|uniref:Uncharacterized protein n=1 Tax=Prorocentrum cordatum TaxID=2364126 RepID=A0ABN9R9Z7_9DINO|nr:unnamed protein product [Polarella glacialis]
MATEVLKLSETTPSSASSLSNCAPVAPSNTYAELEPEPTSVSKTVVTTTRAKSELMASAWPNLSPGAMSSAVSLSSCAPVATSNTYAAPDRSSSQAPTTTRDPSELTATVRPDV